MYVPITTFNIGYPHERPWKRLLKYYSTTFEKCKGEFWFLSAAVDATGKYIQSWQNQFQKIRTKPEATASGFYTVCGLVLRFSEFLLSTSAYKNICSQWMPK